MRIAIACGDPSGVGPEVTLKALSDQLASDACCYQLFGDFTQLSELNVRLQLNLEIVAKSDFDAGVAEPRITVHSAQVPTLNLPLLRQSAAGARAAIRWLEASAAACMRATADALVTAPVCKESIIDAGHPDFVGQTEFLSKLAGTDRTIMMLLGCDDRQRWLRVALVTTHLALRQVHDAISADKVELAIQRAIEACRDLELPRARIGVCGLNPHAGEGGKLGTEERTCITPGVQAARRHHAEIVGPLPADTLFHYAYKGEYDAVVAMYHDQGLVPLKMIGFENGINWTLGLPFIRTSPDHGTAYDIAGKDIANPSSMIAALRLAKQLARRRGAGV